MAEVELGKRLELLQIAGPRGAHRRERDLGTFLDAAERQAGPQNNWAQHPSVFRQVGEWEL